MWRRKKCDLKPREKLSTDTAAASAAKSLQSCPTLCDPIDGSPPGSPIPGILQARTLEWVAISFSNAWKWKVKAKLLSCVWLLAIPWTAAYQAPLPMGFYRQEYWSRLPLPSPKGLTIYKSVLFSKQDAACMFFCHLSPIYINKTVNHNPCCLHPFLIPFLVSVT